MSNVHVVDQNLLAGSLQLLLAKYETWLALGMLLHIPCYIFAHPGFINNESEQGG